MKKSLPFVAILVAGALTLSSSCNQQKETVAADTNQTDVNDPQEEVNGKPEGIVDFITVQQGYRPDGSSAPYSIEKAEVIKDVLHLRLKYSGGCEEHRFAVFSNKMYAKSLPPQLTLFLEHDSKGDKCREMVTKDVYFHLNNIQYPGTDKVVLRINDLKIEPLTYEYSN